MGSPWIYKTCRSFQLEADEIEYARRHAEHVFAAWDYVTQIILHDGEGNVVATFEAQRNGKTNVKVDAKPGRTVDDLMEMLK